MATYQEDTSYNSMDRDSKFESQETVDAKLHNVESDEIESRPAGQAPSFVMRVMLTSAVVFFIAVALEVVIMHSIIGNAEVDVTRRVFILAIGSAIWGAVMGMIVAFMYVMKKTFDYKNAMGIMIGMLILLMIGLAIWGDNPILHQYVAN